jgi:hypothetical protein
MPLLAVETHEHDLVESLPAFKRRMDWFFEHRVYLRDQGNAACIKSPGKNSRRLSSIVNPERLVRVLQPMLYENDRACAAWYKPKLFDNLIDLR